jgi:hypothetical protein
MGTDPRRAPAAPADACLLPLLLSLLLSLLSLLPLLPELLLIRLDVVQKLLALSCCDPQGNQLIHP